MSRSANSSEGQRRGLDMESAQVFMKADSNVNMTAIEPHGGGYGDSHTACSRTD